MSTEGVFERLVVVCEELRDQMRQLTLSLQNRSKDPALETRSASMIVTPVLTPLGASASGFGEGGDLMNAEEAYRYLRFKSRRALYAAIPVEGIPTRRRGRTLLFSKQELNRWTAGTPTGQLMKEARSRTRDE